MSPGSEAPIFIIGTERSGSNLLRLILNAHSRITVPHPPHFMRFLEPLAASYGDLTVERNRRALVDDALGLLARHIHPWPHPIDAERVVATAGPSLFEVVAAVYDQYRAAEGKARWGCKSTFMVEHVDEVARVFPDARFVWLVRDPQDVASSAKRAVFGPCHPYRMARLWRAEQERALAALARRGPDAVHRLRYEDLVARPEEELRTLCAFLGEGFEPSMLAHHTSPAARRTASLSESWRRAGDPIGTGRVGAHRTGLSPRERLLVDKVTAPLKERLGYPVDPRSPYAPDPSPSSVALRSALLRSRVEYRSMRQDENHRLRLARDAYVRWLRLKSLARRTEPTPRASVPTTRNGLPVTTSQEDVTGHFAARSATYDRSSSWCTDAELGRLVIELTRPRPEHRVLDVACGTGLVSRLFGGRVAEVTGVDITPEMADRARPHLDRLVIAPAESLPFPDDSFDVVVCRQGVQFMTLPDAAAEMVRVLRPGGRIVLVNLCAYGTADRAEYFEVLRLRNPVRRHFFLPQDLEALLRAAGCEEVELHRFVSAEDVDVWSDNGAIEESRREAIREVYRNASAEFLSLHAVKETDGGFVDQMLFVAAAGRKP
ncbi:sulfotransferase [Streptomyces sp. NPDC049906]|uniref:sulfotransferase n=1 Tax=Streptomyces sp. NPDC049906 TaxID=3155656 RepID=UPI003425B096